jgi:hypothetical protein
MASTVAESSPPERSTTAFVMWYTAHHILHGGVSPLSVLILHSPAEKSQMHVICLCGRAV